MKYLSIFICCLLPFIGQAQTLKPTETQGLILVLLLDKNDKPLQDQVFFTSKKTNKTFSVKTNSYGMAEILLPTNDFYTVSLEFEPKYDEIEIPNQAYFGMNYQIGYDKQRKTAAKDAIVRINLHTASKKMLSEEITLISQKTKKTYKATTDTKGNTEFKLPNNDEYTINYKSAPNYGLIKIPNEDNFILQYEAIYEGSKDGAVYPNRENALFAFTFIDLDSLPVAGETFTLQAKNNKKLYTAITNKKGEAFMLVPLGDTYTFSATYYPNFGEKKVDAKTGLYKYDVSLMFVSSADFLKQQAAEEARTKAREDSWKIWQKAREEQKKIEQENQQRIADLKKTLEGRKKLFEEREAEFKKWKEAYDATIDKVTMMPTFRYNPISDTAVNAVLNRHTDWKRKLMVVDVTGSMTPYSEQLADWHELNWAKQDQIQYVFFNDGNNKPDAQKVIGNTGGIFYSKKTDKQTFKQTMTLARENGNGGDQPENDLEAVIAAINNCNNYDEIVLVADNFAKVRDISLLSQINKPIKIILCGATHNTINTDYLDIAFATKGSVHTIEQDIVDIAATIDGAKIKIGDTYYILTKDKFLVYKQR